MQAIRFFFSKRYYYLVLLLAMIPNAFMAQNQAYTIESVPNSRLRCNKCYVTNPDGILSLESENRLNELISQLEQKTGVEVAIVAIESIGTEDYNDFAYKLFNKWGIGKEQKNNGLLILLVSNERAVKIETGTGLEGLMPDAYCSRVLEETVFPYFKRGNFDQGFEDGITRIAQDLTTQSAMEELLLTKKKPQNTLVNVLCIYLIIAILVFIALYLWSYYVISKLHGGNDQRYKQMQDITITTTIIGYIFPFPVLLLALWLKRKRKAQRECPIACDKCGSTMHLLTESQEDEYLYDSQKAEENVKSVDYDVWLCDTCHNTKTFKYLGNTLYTKCPHCGALTYKLETDKIVMPATSIMAGKGIKIYGCKNCHYQEKDNYIIPRIIVVSSGAGLGSGRGGFGGGFGGGMSGGGGAGGRF